MISLRAGCTAFGLLLFAATAYGQAPTLDYNKDIRPILAENCFACHGPDSAARKADLRLDQRDAAIEMGVIVPNDVAGSTLIERILSEDPQEVMPPPQTKKALTPGQKKLLEQWIKEGAEYKLHWSLIAPERPELPAVKNAAWVRNPIDQFVLASLESAGQTPADEADRRTLARRLSLDLTGLPPSPEEVEAFVNDTDPNAYEKLVDRWLGSIHWGEHRGRYWLDAARYADTHGIHFDNYREVWSYRDWVISAFNRNMPFDQFTIEQLAGDLLPDRTLEQQIASGFNRCNITTNEGGTIDEEYLVLYTRDRTETTAQVWLGLTAGCAVCHTHKFDALTQHEFYQLAAFFNNTTQNAKDGNIQNTPPIIRVPRPEDRPRADELVGQLAAAQQAVAERRQQARPEFDQWQTTAPPASLDGIAPSDGLHLHATLNGATETGLPINLNGVAQEIAVKDLKWEAGPNGSGQSLQVAEMPIIEIPQAGDFEHDTPFTAAAWVKLPEGAANGAIIARMDDEHDFRGWDFWVENGRIGMHLVHQWPGNALKVLSNNPVKAGEWHHLCVTYDGSRTPQGVVVYVDGEVSPSRQQANSLRNTVKTEVPLKIGQRHTTSRLNGLGLQDLRIYRQALPGGDVRRLAKSTRAAALLAKATADRTDAERNELYEFWLAGLDTTYMERAKVVSGIEQEQLAIQARGTIAHVMQEKNEEAMAFLLFRGEYDQRRDPVQAKTPAVLPPMPDDLPRNRLGFAQWLLRPENPLTARVTVNRFWQELFGTGLVRTTGDFGVAGEVPSHPELLDWMAVEFREKNWDIKQFFRLIVLSSTYRQAAVATPEKVERDPSNRLLSRGPRFRMDAEVIRDYALSASGLLVPKIGGPSVRPYQPEGVWEAVAMIESNTHDYRQDSGENLYRRSMYTFWKRSAPPASLDIFNAPSREVCTVRRERTNTPLQALVTLNDVQFVEAARHLAQHTLQHGGATVEERTDYLTRRLMSRTLRPEERAIVAASLEDLAAYYTAHPEDAQKLITVGESKPDAQVDPATLAAWTMLANELLNLDEVLNK